MILMCVCGLVQTKALMDKLQKTVSSEGRFKNLRETLKKWDFANVFTQYQYTYHK